MARSSWSQTNFLGGQWSASAQGRLDLPDYKIALAQCVNAYPQEEGSITRRSGLRMCGPTWFGQFAVTISWDIAQEAVYDLEISVKPGISSQLRFWQGDQPIVDSVATITGFSAASPTVMALSAPVSWNTSEIIMINVPALSGATAWAPVLNRQMALTKLDNQHFSLTDAVTGAPISGIGLPAVPAFTVAGHILVFSLPYTTIAQLFQLCPVASNFQGVQQLYLLTHGVAPIVVALVTPPALGSWPTFSVTIPFFQGPYQPLNTAQNGSVSGSSGIVTLVDSGTVHPNGGIGFQAGDVGRAIRLLSQPPPFNGAHAYSAGDAAFWHGVAYQCNANTTGQLPDQTPAVWFVAPQLIVWVDGVITGLTNTVTVSVNLSGVILPTQNGLTITTYTLGVYNATFGVWPSCGTFHEGRLWLGGAVNNELDGSEVQNLTSFRPTDLFGNVLSTSACLYTLLSPINNPMLWMIPDQGGILIGTQGEEWLVSSTNNNNILTPITMQAHRQTKYGSFLHQPVHAGLSLIFIQRYARIIFEYLIDVFALRFGGLPINERAKQVTGFVSQLAYVENTIPSIWARTFGGGLVGCTYRRTSRFVSQPPEFKGWHQHNLAGIAPFISSISTSAFPQAGGSIVDAVAAVTGTGLQTGAFYRQILMPPYDPANGDQYAWHLDGAVTGLYANSLFQPNIFVGLSAIEDGTNMYFLGLWYQPSIVSVYIAGIYFGDFPVTQGSVTVPYNSDPGGLGTRTYLATQLVQSGTNGACSVQGLGFLPVCIGSKFTSMIQLLRQDVQDESRSPMGMAVGETRRTYMASAFVSPGYNGSATAGVDNQPPYPMVFRPYIGGTALANNQPFGGIWQDTVNDDADYDGQLIINVTGPQPFTLNNITPFTETEER